MSKTSAKKNVSTQAEDADLRIIQDAWKYKWSDSAPLSVFEHRVVYRQLPLIDIIVNNWSILDVAVCELAKITGHAQNNVKFDWLLLNDLKHNRYLLGIYQNKYVVSIAPLTSIRSEFSPYSINKSIVSQLDILKGMTGQCSYRHSLHMIDTGGIIQLEGMHMGDYPITYNISVSVHNRCYLWASVQIGDSVVSAPGRIRLPYSLDNLKAYLEQANKQLSSFIQHMAITWFSVAKREKLESVTQVMAEELRIQPYMVYDLKQTDKLSRCLTYLDWLLLLCKYYAEDSTPKSINRLIQLSNAVNKVYESANAAKVNRRSPKAAGD